MLTGLPGELLAVGRLAGMLDGPSGGKGGTGPVYDPLRRAHLAVRVHGPNEDAASGP